MKRIILAITAMCLTGVLFANPSITIGFKYENITTETKMNQKGEVIEKTVTEEGQPSINLQLLDQVIFALREKAYTVSTDASKESDYKVVINPVFLQYGINYVCSTLVEVYAKDTLVAHDLLSDDKNPVRLSEGIAKQITRFISDNVK